MNTSRRKFLKSASGLLVPITAIAGPGLPFYIGKTLLPVQSGLLTGLVSYWKFDTSPGATKDSIGVNDWTFSNIGSGFGEINQCAVGVNTGFSFAANVTAPFNAGPGVSFTINFWISSSGSGYVTGAGLVTKWSATVNDYAFWINGSNFLEFIANANDGSGSKTVDGPSTGALGLGWHMVSGGYDAATQRIWMQVDNGTRTFASCADVKAQAVRLEFNEFAFTSNDQNANYDEMGFWGRLLNTNEISSLYNGGTALPLSSFT